MLGLSFCILYLKIVKAGLKRLYFRLKVCLCFHQQTLFVLRKFNLSIIYISKKKGDFEENENKNKMCVKSQIYRTNDLSRQGGSSNFAQIPGVYVFWTKSQGWVGTLFWVLQNFYDQVFRKFAWGLGGYLCNTSTPPHPIFLVSYDFFSAMRALHRKNQITS